ncbi:MAG: TonB-dependent receptor [Candidatus Cyclobacteriaceae bacterium M3_2C_046]
MKKVLLTMLINLIAWSVMAQTGVISGRVLDQENDEGLIGANVVVKGTSKGSLTDIEGDFTINGVEPGAKTIIITFVGYTPQQVEVNVKANEVIQLGTIPVKTNTIGLKEIEVIASVAQDRRTPVAVSTIKSQEIENRVGNQEFPEILRSTPSVYVTKQGGGFGDSRINVRGFDQRNTAVMINGIPVNDMENGWVYWSNWAGLSDVTSQIQVQRGLGATKLAVASVGGSINIVTNAAEIEKGMTASVSVGNDLYQKYGISASTGLGQSGWAFTVQGSHTRGDGYADGTQFEGWSYFASLAKQINTSHSLHFTVLGAPQWHFQREYGTFDGVTIETILGNEVTGSEGFGIKYNPQWGYWNGSDFKDNEFSWRKNFYHKPKAFLNHYWTFSDRTELSTSAYASFGRGGGTGDLGRINGSFRTSGKFKTDEGIVRWNDIQSWNTGGNVPAFGDDQIPWQGPGMTDNTAYSGPFAGQNVAESWRNGMILRASMNEHNWYGLLSNLTHQLSDNWNLVAGVDARYYKGLHYRRVENLLGLDAYFDDDDINEPAKYLTDEGRADGNQIDYNNDGLVNWLGLFGQLEYISDKLSAFASLSGSNQGFKRIDYFQYEDDSEEQESDWENFLGGTLKAGANYNLTENHNVFANAGYFSRQPIFDNVFLNFTNEVNEDVKNQSVVAFELGYGYRSKFLSGNINVYHTEWGDRQVSRGAELRDGDTRIEGNVNFSNIAQVHQGVEVDFVMAPTRKLKINGMLSLGNWRYNQNFTATFVPDDQELRGQYTQDFTLYMEEVKVPDAAQTTFSLGANYEIFTGFHLYGNFYFADDLYADFDLADDESFDVPGNQAWKLPNYSLLDAGISYNFEISGIAMTWNLNVNNLLDEEYMAESESNILFDPAREGDVEFGENGSIRNRVYFGFGRTWNTGLKVRF